MKALVVYAHQSASSFNAAVKKVTSKTLSDKKFKVEESDLYAMNFKATATAEDITGKHLRMYWKVACDYISNDFLALLSLQVKSKIVNTSNTLRRLS